MNDGSFFQRPAPEAVEPPSPPPGGLKEPDAEWLGMLHQLACFQMQHGHCDVDRQARRHPKLALWLRRQMELHAKGRLPGTQLRELEVLGVDWKAVPPPAKRPTQIEARWEERFAELLEFKKEHGHLHVPKSRKTLVNWMQLQRKQHKQKRIPPKRQKLLEEAGFEWKTGKWQFAQGWDERFAELAAFKEKHGHLRVTLKNQLSPGLMHWRDNQRIRLSQGSMKPDQKARLDALGFEWESPGRANLALGERNTALWEKRFAELLAFRERHGHCDVTDKSGPNAALATWTRVQRRNFHENTLRPERRRRLEEIGFAWKSERLPFAEAWEERFAELAAFKEKHGHLRVTLKNEPSFGLMHWRDNQRLRLRYGRMPQEQKARLDALGFEWEGRGRTSPALEDHNVALWEERFAELLAFHETHGHYRVPRDTKPHSTLASWILTQRRHFHENTLLPERRRRLEEIGFAWKAGRLRFAKPWDERLAELAAFKEKHGHLRVTLKNQLSPGMMHWRDNQRIRLSQGSMKPDQKARLDALGFEWESPGRTSPAREDSNVALWEQMFEKLLAWRARQGHCQVPNTREEDPTLVKWVQRQRQHHKNNTLLPERRQRLEEIGFAWKSDKLVFARAWDERFAELAAFKERHGHLHVTMASQTSPGLAHWRDNQRLRLRAGKMPPEQEARLDALDMRWRESQPQPPVSERTKWERHFERLTAFHQLHGHADVPARPDRLLRKWVLEQRARHAEGSLDEERTARLEALGFSWVTPATVPEAGRERAARPPKWRERFEELRQFADAYGHFHVPKYKAEYKRLHSWVVAQRFRRRTGSLSPECEQRLDALGFPWEVPASQLRAHTAPSPVWEERHAELAAFKDEHGHFRVPRHKAEYKRLQSWVVAQRVYRRKGSLSPECEQRLDALGFPWNPGSSVGGGMGTKWQQRFEELRQFADEHGHFSVPKHKAEYKKLHHWVVAQRVYRRKGSLSQKHVEKLDALGFPWNPGSSIGGGGTKWQQRFEELRQFAHEHGHFRVPNRKTEYKKLHYWVVTQRVHRRKGSLRQQHVEKLDALGFPWNPGMGKKDFGSQWEANYQKLRAFHARHGHANVPTKHPPDPLLGHWISNTRIARKKGRLSEHQIQKLDELGFAWRGDPKCSGLLASKWEKNFASLAQYHEDHGHANIPSTDKEHASLAVWLTTQRLNHRQGKLTAERTRKLESLGVRWGKAVYQKGFSRTWDQRLEELAAFRRQHGHPHVTKADEAHRSLEIWSKMQRVAYHKGRLSADRAQRLEALGFRWIGTEAFWERQFRRWQAATQRRRTRHLTPAGDGDDDLVKWEQTQRTLHRQGRLAPARAELLARAGMILEKP